MAELKNCFKRMLAGVVLAVCMCGVIAGVFNAVATPITCELVGNEGHIYYFEDVNQEFWSSPIEWYHDDGGDYSVTWTADIADDMLNENYVASFNCHLYHWTTGYRLSLLKDGLTIKTTMLEGNGLEIYHWLVSFKEPGAYTFELRQRCDDKIVMGRVADTMRIEREQ
jgi:hypothetical protein